MEDELSFTLDHAKEQMQKTINHLESELLKIRAGKANPQMLEGIFVDYYGANTPLANVANINTPDARTLVIQPWEKSMLAPIGKVILAANLGLNPQDDGALIRINIPMLTEDRRKDLVKQSRAEAEHAKVGIRSNRRDANEAIKKLQKDGLAEDLAKDGESKVQQLTDNYIAKVEEKLEQKEKEIMTV
jgi:ribosome recycling factor